MGSSNVHNWSCLRFTSYQEVKENRYSNAAHLLCAEHSLSLRANFTPRQMLLLPCCRCSGWGQVCRGLSCSVSWGLFYIWPLASKELLKCGSSHSAENESLTVFSKIESLNACPSIRTFPKCVSCSFVHSFRAQVSVVVEMVFMVSPLENTGANT